MEKDKLLPKYFKTRCELFQTKLDDLINYKEQKENLSGLAYYKEFGSINLDFGRQTGCTYWLRYFIDECEKHQLNTDTFFINNGIRKYFIRDFRRDHETGRFDPMMIRVKADYSSMQPYSINDRHRLHLSSYMREEAFCSRRTDFVVIDVSSCVKNLDEVIKKASVMKPKLFILL